MWRRLGIGGTATMVVALLAFLVLNVLTPFYHDDFVYRFMFEGGSVNYGHRVGSLGDIIASQVEHYFTVNGRSPVHSLVQLFAGLLGKSVFNLLNVIVLGVFLVLLVKPVARHARGTWHGAFIVTVTLVLVLLLPRFKDTFLWMTGSINYLWSATAALAFLLMYERRRQRVMGPSAILPMVVALLLGWSHEGITLPLAAALVFLELIHVKSRGRHQGLWLVLAFLTGSCVIALAPGTIARSGMAGGLSPSALGLKVIAGFQVLAKLKIVYLALLASAVAWFADRGTAKRTISRNSHLLLAMLLSLGIVFASGMESSRTAFGLEFFALIYLLALLGAWLPRLDNALARWCSIGLMVGLTVFYGLLLRHTVASWQESQRLMAQIERTSDGIIGTDEHHAGRFSSFICTMLSPDSTVNAMNYDPKGWPASIAATYGRDSLIFLPQAFLDDLKARPGHYDTLHLETPLKFYAQRIGHDASIQGVTFILAENDYSDVPLLLRPIARRMNRYNDTAVTTTKWVTLDLYGSRYLLIKKDHTLHPRLLDIRVTATSPAAPPGAHAKAPSR